MSLAAPRMAASTASQIAPGKATSKGGKGAAPRLWAKPRAVSNTARAAAPRGKTSNEFRASNLRHIIDIRVSLMNDCQFCLQMHTKEALKGGDTQDRVDALKHWQNSDLFDAREKAALAWAEVLTRSGSQTEVDATYGDLAPHFNKDEIALLTVVVGHINAWNRIGIASWAH